MFVPVTSLILGNSNSNLWRPWMCILICSKILHQIIVWKYRVMATYKNCTEVSLQHDVFFLLYLLPTSLRVNPDENLLSWENSAGFFRANCAIDVLLSRQSKDVLLWVIHLDLKQNKWNLSTRWKWRNETKSRWIISWHYMKLKLFANKWNSLR